MFKASTSMWRGLALVLVVSLVLAACGTSAAATTAPTSAPKPTEAAAPATAVPSGGAFVSKPSDKTTPSGFVCPEPQPKMELTSKQVNLFVWTEYIPQDIIDCFQLVYGITVNRDEYSANEEMYAKISKGNTSYDLVQPTDFFVRLMVRQNLLQKLDKSRLTIMGNFAPANLNLPYDPNNEYTLPYKAGTDSIVYNSDVIKEAPTSWKDLWKPGGCVSKNMVMLDGAHDIIGATLISLGYDINTKDQKQLDEAKAKLI